MAVMSERASSLTDTVEIRLLGNLRIRDASGDPIDLAALRTRKTLDLLRLLALRVGEPVAGPLLVQRLWPDVSEQRGRASLRTAASTIRGALGADRLERRLGGLALCGVWVDTVAFTTLAVQSRISLREGRPAEAVVAAREAEALYLHDFRADDDAASWVATERDQLRATYGRLLEDTAEAALALGWYRDVEDFASRAIASDPFAERPVRALMTAFAATGQVERALRVFQACRHALVEELGVDPSAQTEELHLSILRGDVAAPAPPAVPLVGRDLELERLTSTIRRGVMTGRPCVVELRGFPGSGQRRLLDEACRRAGLRWRPRTEDEDPGHRAGDPVLVETARTFVNEQPSGPGGGVRVVVSSQHDPDVRAVTEGRGWEFHGIDLPVLDLEAAGRLTEAAFGGAPSTELLRELVGSTGGAPGEIVRAARRLMRAAGVVSTSEGLARTHVHEADDRSKDAAAMVARAMEALPTESHEVLHVLAVADVPLPLPTVLELLASPDPGSVRTALTLLADVSILSSTAEGHRFRHPLAAVAVRSWLRPSARRSLSARVAACPAVPIRARVSAWSRAGEPARARRLALDAVARLQAAGQETEAAALREWAGTLAARLDPDPTGVWPDDGTPVAPDAPRRAAGAVPRRRPVDVDDLARELGLTPETDRDAAQAVLTQALRSAAAVDADAEHAGGTDRVAAISVLLAERVLAPGRSLEPLDALVDGLAAHTTSPDLLGEAEILRWLPRVLLGYAAEVRGRIEEAAAQEGRPTAVAARLRHLAVLAEHDLGCTATNELDACDGQTVRSWRFLPVRLLADRPGLVLPGQQLGGGGMAGTPMLRQLHALAEADRHESTADRAAALRVLRAAAADAVATGCTLMLPEISARLVILGCQTDERQAQADFDLMDDTLGVGATHPRELFLRYVARAHVRSVRGDMRGAAAAADSAADVARTFGLLPLVRQATGLAARLHDAVRTGGPRHGAGLGPRQAGSPVRTRAATVPTVLDRPSGPTVREPAVVATAGLAVPPAVRCST